MRRVSVTKARTAIADIVNSVAFAKERVILDRSGKEVAAIVPIEDLRLLEQMVKDRQESTGRLPNLPLSAIKAICKKYKVRELLLFGSYAKGEATPDSDIDLLVEFKPGSRTGFIALAKMQAELEEVLGKKVDLVPKRGLKPAIRKPALSSAQLLYAA